MTLVLIDGHSIAYRSYFALIRNPLRDTKGRNTSAVYGFLQALDKIEKHYPTDHMVVTFDAGRRVFRHDKFADYKKDRKPMPDDLIWQVPMISDIARLQGLPVLLKEGFEADDIMATIVERFKEKFSKIVVVSGDKDLMQMVGGNVVVYDPYKDQEFDAPAVKEKLGVPPERVTDLLALMGDSTDGIPGVPGIGPKRATALLAKYGDLKTALEKEEKLKDHREAAELSYELVQLHKDVPVELNEKNLHRAEPDEAELQSIYNELGFTSRLSAMKVRDKTAKLEITKGEFKPKKGDPISFIFEEKLGQRDMFDESEEECYGGCYGWMRILASDGFTFAEISDDRASELLADESYPKILWAAKPLLRKGYEIKGRLFDIHLMAFVENSDLSLRTLDRVLVHSAGRPIASDADRLNLMHQAAQRYEKEIRDVGAWKVYEEIEVPLIPVLARMEQRGVRLDTSYFGKLTEEWEGELGKLEEEIYKLADRKFTIGSPKQLAEVLFDELGLKPRKRTKTGYSTAAGVLEEMADEHPVIPKVLEWRTFSKMLTTYLRPLVTLVDNESRIHTFFDQTGAATGRLSTHDPNLQNIPIRGERGPLVRKGFVAAPGYKLISADYSQIELRVLAHIAEDEALAKVFHDGRDVHTETSMRIFGVDEKNVTRDHRRMAKAINYGIIYGMGPYGFARRMWVSTEEAALFIERYLASFPKVSAWREQILVEAREKGYVSTIAGRIRRVPQISDRMDIAERAALNAPIQGSAADIIKKAMITVEKNLEKAGIEPGMLLQIHDELLFEVKKSEVEEAKKIIKKDMESAYKLSVPLEVEIGVGNNWAEAH
ncbi:MAG: DNA polymerase I [candidate division WOR-3 bacterium]|nr:DNA polymerase I [candidate division WOR-3 bacterium]